MIYLDSSAMLRLVLDGENSDQLSTYLRAHSAQRTVSSALAVVEVRRAIMRNQASRHEQEASEVLLAGSLMVPISSIVITEASRLKDRLLRSLDAIHLATARVIGADLTGFIAYDKRLDEAARTLGLPCPAS